MIALPDHISHTSILPLYLLSKGEHTRHNPVSSSIPDYSPRWKGIYDKFLYLFTSEVLPEEVLTSSIDNLLLSSCEAQKCKK